VQADTIGLAQQSRTHGTDEPREAEHAHGHTVRASATRQCNPTRELVDLARHGVLHVVGARPNMPKAAPVIRALTSAAVPQVIVNTGQHYDDAMSASLMRALDMPSPDIDLAVGSDTHARQTAAVMTALEPVLLEQEPALVVVYGDVNSTLAAALTATKMGVPVAHVEAGLRSHDTSMPEEVNRRIVDHMSALLFVTSPDAWVNLRTEGLADDRAIEVGNPMIDSLVRMRDSLDFSQHRAELGLPDEYLLATIHRPSNVDDPAQATAMVDLVAELGARIPVVLPLHPRSQGPLAALRGAPGVQVRDPLPYPHFLAALAGARLVLTDSGGVQEESSFLGIPCITVRTSTERPVTITHGTNRLSSIADTLDHADRILAAPMPAAAEIPMWDGRAGERIATALVPWLESPTGGHHG
jgi:UDP-N-acetylglucosamine 2-epimerase (non-hydrolysing)